MQVRKIDGYIEFEFQTSRFDTGAAADADATPTYRVYEENNETAVATGDCAKRDDANTTGLYLVRVQATAAAGFEVGKSYFVRVAATVNSVSAAGVIGEARIVPDNVFDALCGGTDTLQVDLLQVGGDAQSALDLKGFADDGYDPETNKVEGVKLVDTTTANTDMVAAAPTAASVADAVWDETATGHTGGGKAGDQLWTDVDAIAVDVAGLDGAAMRGTDSAALASDWTAARAAMLDVPISSREPSGRAVSNHVRYVDWAAGSDSNDGSVGSPWASVAHAMDAGTSGCIRDGYGDTLYILGSSADELVYCPAADEGLTISKSNVNIIGGGRRLVWRRQTLGDTITLTGDHILLRNICVRNIGGNGKAAVLASGIAPVLQNIFIDSCLGMGIYTGTGGNARIEDCLIITPLGSANIYKPITLHGENDLVRGCVIVGSKVDGIEVMGWCNIVLDNVIGYCDDAGIYMDGPSDGIIARNVTGQNVAADYYNAGAVAVNNEQWATETELVTTDAVADAIKVVTDKLATMLASSGDNWQYTADALELAPSGGSGTADWTANERTAIRAILGVVTDNATPGNPTSGILDTIRDSIDAIIPSTEPDGFPVTVTVTIGGDPVLGARVTLQAETGATTYSTDADGEITDFVRPAGTYALTIPGTGAYQDYTGSVVVDAEGNVTGDTVTLTTNSLPLPTAASCYALYNTETDENDEAVGAGDMTVTVVDLSVAGRVDATNDRFRSIWRRSAQTDVNGQWSLDIPIAAFTAGALLTLQLAWTDAGGDAQAEEWCAKLVAPTAPAVQVCWSDLAPRAA